MAIRASAPRSIGQAGEKASTSPIKCPDMNDDPKRLAQILRAAPPCVSILTYEEAQALAVVHAAAAELSRGVMEWSVIRGLRDAAGAGGAKISDTEHPAAALFFLSTMA